MASPHASRSKKHRAGGQSISPLRAVEFKARRVPTGLLSKGCSNKSSTAVDDATYISRQSARPSSQSMSPTLPNAPRAKPTLPG